MPGLFKYLLPGKKGLLSAIVILALFSFCDLLTIKASAKSYTITASAEKGGSISPEGKVKVERGDSQTFLITPDAGYEIEDVEVDGDSQGAISSYTFTDVRKDHKIKAKFSPRTYTITASAGEGGGINPSGEDFFDFGNDQTYEITPDNSYDILDVEVDGSSVGAVSSYTFNNISSDHTIHATFSSTLGVLDVSIPDQSMKIGDVVTATLSVVNDAGEPYTLVSGTVGGYPLSVLQRISPTSYRATFTIIQGGNSYNASQNIPVSNLVLSKGSRQSPSYDSPIMQANDPIDALLPMISSMVVTGGTRKIGDVVMLNIQADGPDYTAHSLTSINGISLESPNVSFTASGGGAYILSYVVREGDRDVIPGVQALEASVILVKPSGNMGLPYSEIDNVSQITIDAHAPVISKLEVPSLAIGPGRDFKVNITADETGYSAGPGTLINGVPLSSSRVTFTERSYGFYDLSYVVAQEDNDVAPGNLQVTIVPVDQAGNAGRPYSLLEPNVLEIYTTYPEGVIAGPSGICAGEEAELTIMLSGRAPWDLTLNEGGTTIDVTNITSANYSLVINPESTITYGIVSVTDVNGVENTGSGSLTVKVNDKTEVEIINLATGYSVEAEPIQLEANVMGGSFSGPGVISSTGYFFYPELAGISDTPHTIDYTYENANGCVSSANKSVFVLGSDAAILMPSGTVCANQDPFVVSVINVIGEAGSFRLLDAASQPSPGIEDHGDNTATIDPAVLDQGRYAIEFEYVDGETLYLSEAFTLETVSTPQILSLDESSYCQNVLPIELHSDLEKVRFEGSGVSQNMNNGYIFNPANVVPGNVTISCIYESENGCSAGTERNVEVLAAAEARFGMNTSCIPEGGEIVSFINQTTGSSYVDTWRWEFGDAASGKNNQSDLMDPTHFYEDPGQKIISLTAVTTDGCVSTYVIDSLIDSKPVADFTWISNCQPHGAGVKFINLSEYGSGSADSVIWRFKTMEGNVIDEFSSVYLNDTMIYPFPETSDYQVELYTANGGGCADVLTKEIRLQPTIQLNSEGYQETFDLSGGLWTAHSENQAQSWVWNIPDFSGFTQVPGDRAWYTQLPAGAGDYSEHSWVQSPCFDLSEIDRPLIKMDIMRSFVPVLNGAVLQYQDVIGEGWKTLGSNTPGIEWYNTGNILQQPGGSSTGWGMEVFNPDTEWITAIHDLDQVAGKSDITFRIAIATNGKEGLGNQGFAFDNVLITGRSKVAVLEHFTDYWDDSSSVADDIIDAVWRAHPKDVIDLQYHMSFSGLDPMNANNPDPPSVRAFNYGVPRVPYTVLDGGASVDLRYDLAALRGSSMEDQLRLLTLEVPDFDLDLSVDWQETGLVAQTTVTCETDRFEDNIQLYLVVFETSVTSYSGRDGDSHFRNVVLDILPTSTGTLLGDKWVRGKSDIRSHTWSYKPYVEDIDDLAMAAFVQDRRTNRILQSVVVHKDQTVGVPKLKSESFSLTIYPNPSSQIIFTDLGSGSNVDGKMELWDLSGKKVMEEVVPPGTRIMQMEIGHLQKGIYVLRWIEAGQVLGLGKVVKIE
jgi:hypothetical protein